MVDSNASTNAEALSGTAEGSKDPLGALWVSSASIRALKLSDGLFSTMTKLPPGV